jgi:hypothetical protein
MQHTWILLLIVILFSFLFFRESQREKFTTYESATWGDGQCCDKCNVNYSGYIVNPPIL